MLNDKVKESFLSLKDDTKRKLSKIKESASKDLEIDGFDIDGEVLKTPKILSKYNDIFTDETLVLKDMYTLKEKIKLERWKYWSGKQTDNYYVENGILHEKILKTDIDKYLAADEKIILINDVISIQKAIVDYLERCIKEIQSRNFHCKVAVDWRKFQSGGI